MSGMYITVLAGALAKALLLFKGKGKETNKVNLHAEKSGINGAEDVGSPAASESVEFTVNPYHVKDEEGTAAVFGDFEMTKDPFAEAIRKVETDINSYSVMESENDGTADPYHAQTMKRRVAYDFFKEEEGTSIPYSNMQEEEEGTSDLSNDMPGDGEETVAPYSSMPGDDEATVAPYGSMPGDDEATVAPYGSMPGDDEATVAPYGSMPGDDEATVAPYGGMQWDDEATVAPYGGMRWDDEATVAPYGGMRWDDEETVAPYGGMRWDDEETVAPYGGMQKDEQTTINPYRTVNGGQAMDPYRIQYDMPGLGFDDEEETVNPYTSDWMPKLTLSLEIDGPKSSRTENVTFSGSLWIGNARNCEVRLDLPDEPIYCVELTYGGGVLYARNISMPKQDIFLDEMLLGSELVPIKKGKCLQIGDTQIMMKGING